jgi:chemotaxis protein MotB
MRRRRHRRRVAEAMHSDRWLVSYADLITLLFAFFTVLYAISSVDGAKARSVTESMASALSLGPPAPMSSAGVASTGVESTELVKTPIVPPTVPPLAALAAELRQLAGSAALAGRVRIGEDRRGVVVSLAEGGFFESGSSDVRQDAMIALDQLAQSLKSHDQVEPLELTIEGHTDDRPVRDHRRTNWDLSTARATAVVARLVDRHAFSPAKLAAAGYGEWRPVAPNDTPEGRARNRRVDILVRLESAPQP